jgi:hypothetical protein
MKYLMSEQEAHRLCARLIRESLAADRPWVMYEGGKLPMSSLRQYEKSLPIHDKAGA